MIDPVTAQKIKDAADIVEVVGDYVHLIRRGANYMGLCPFHNERTPSFSVNKRKNFCYCFSCKKGGSPVNFIMEKEGLSYHDALLHLARKYGIEVQERELTDEEKARQSEREAMLVANEWAMQRMESNLFETDEGRDIGLQYFYHRGVTDEAIRKFHLGYSIDKGNDLVEAARKAGYDLDVLKTLGLIGTSQEGNRNYDRFRGRVMFPIMNSSGKVIAFGGRDLKGGLAKYINSPESQLYKKSNELYGIYQARQDIVKEDKCYLVEGYLDVIGMWQSGMKNAVASSGTALTDGQIALIHRFTENITLIYDGDAAGIKASLRGIDMLLSHKMKVKVLLLPDGDDPDSFARKHTPEEFQKYVIDHETDIIRFKARVLLSEVQADPQKKIDAINSVVQSIAHIPDAVSRDVYVQECSSILGVAEETVAKAVAITRGAVVEKINREKMRGQFSESKSAGSYDKTGHTSASPATSYIKQIPSEPSPRRPEIANPLEPLERKIIEYCVKYGYLDLIFDGSEDEEAEQRYSIIDFVSDDIAPDDITFSVGIYSKIFKILQDMYPEFEKAYAEYSVQVNNEGDKRIKDGIDKIALGDLSMSEIELREKDLRNKIEDFKKASLQEFSKNYPGRILASHEDDEVRAIVNELIRERHQLSHIYMRDNNVVEKEEDKLDQLVPRALIEWKNEILNLKLKALFERFRQIATPTGDSEEEKKLQLEMNALMRLRSEVAKELGERIISPKPRK